MRAPIWRQSLLQVQHILPLLKDKLSQKQSLCCYISSNDSPNDKLPNRLPGSWDGASLIQYKPCRQESYQLFYDHKSDPGSSTSCGVIYCGLSETPGYVCLVLHALSVDLIYFHIVFTFMLLCTWGIQKWKKILFSLLGDSWSVHSCGKYYKWWRVRHWQRSTRQAERKFWYLPWWAR